MFQNAILLKLAKKKIIFKLTVAFVGHRAELHIAIFQAIEYCVLVN